MISIGYHIKHAADPLLPISLENLAKKISKPDQKFIGFIDQLRSVMALDQSKYREMKTRLPYVVAASFQPPFRKISNFGKTQYLILDLDHLVEKGLDQDILFKKICADPQTALCFISPSGNGIKVFFKLNQPMFDAGRYSIFYKLFAQDFSVRYNVEQVVDKVTSDVARACFVSYDPNAYFNPEPQPIVMEKYIDFENQLTLQELVKVQKHQENEHKATETLVKVGQDLPSELLQQIRERLNPALKEKAEKKIFVPEQINEIIPMIVDELKKFDIETVEIKNIHYGKQLKLKLQQWWGEINVFYGKRGYSVVKSSKSGSNEKITEIAATVVNSFLAGPQ